MYVESNIEVHCCSGKAKSSTQPKSVCVCGLRYPACNARTPYCQL